MNCFLVTWIQTRLKTKIITTNLNPILLLNIYSVGVKLKYAMLSTLKSLWHIIDIWDIYVRDIVQLWVHVCDYSHMFGLCSILMYICICWQTWWPCLAACLGPPNVWESDRVLQLRQKSHHLEGNERIMGKTLRVSEPRFLW